jgi:glutamate-1-semialdehyde aminotransferase
MAKTLAAFDSELARRANESIAHGALTNSKRASSFIKGVYPTHLSHGKGCYVWDTRGNQYIDFVCGLGVNLLGYAHEEVNQAIVDQLRKGCTLSLGTELEIRTAEKVKEMFPFVEKVRFLKTGTDACEAAVRIARAYSGDNQGGILSSGYHGWISFCESYEFKTPGIFYQNQIHHFNVERQDQGPFKDDPDWQLKRNCGVIVEPVMTEFSDSRRAWLQDLKGKVTDLGGKRVLIFDEVITGFRVPGFSVSKHWAVEPDLICLGKALGGGLPLSVVAGKTSVMECADYFVSSTFAGETLSLAAALKTMTLLQTKYRIDELWEKGAQFLYQFNQIWPDGLIIEGYPTRGVLKGEKAIVDLFLQESCRAGLLFGPSWFFNFPHIDVMDFVLSTCAQVMGRIRRKEVKLEGEPSVVPFAQQVRKQIA